MNTLKRAFLYMARKRGKALIIFLILFTLSTFAVTGASILKSIQEAALSLRQSVGGMIKLEIDKNNSDNWNYEQGAGGVMMDYKGEPVTDEHIQNGRKHNG